MSAEMKTVKFSCYVLPPIGIVQIYESGTLLFYIWYEHIASIYYIDVLTFLLSVRPLV
jgi:hypothetical protein